MRQPGHLSRLPHSTRHTALYDITSGTCRALTYYVYKYRLHSADETFNGDDHKQKAHKAHHDVVARLAEHAHKARGGAQDEVCKHVDKHYRAYSMLFIVIVWASLISTMVLAMAPGPQSIGMPSGVIDMSLA